MSPGVWFFFSLFFDVWHFHQGKKAQTTSYINHQDKWIEVLNYNNYLHLTFHVYFEESHRETPAWRRLLFGFISFFLKPWDASKEGDWRRSRAHACCKLTKSLRGLTIINEAQINSCVEIWACCFLHLCWWQRADGSAGFWHQRRHYWWCGCAHSHLGR